MLKIAIDAMGGDFGISIVVDGVNQALKAKKDFHAYLIGDENEINNHLDQKYKNRVSIVDCKKCFPMEGQATNALKDKETTIYKTIELLRDGECDVAVSAGHSGAAMSLATLRIGRIKGISRPALAAIVPTINATSLVLDVGANTECDENNLFEFAILGNVYSKPILGVKKSVIALISNGEEDTKGSEMTKKAFELCKNIDSFKGNIEGCAIFNSDVNVVVSDGFVGNVFLKTSEGVADAIRTLIKTNTKKCIFSILGALLMIPVFKKLKAKLDYSEYGGGFLLGLKKPVIVGHGKSNATAIKNCIFQAIRASSIDAEQSVIDELKRCKN